MARRVLLEAFIPGAGRPHCGEDLDNLWSSRGEGGTRGTAERPPVPGVRHAQTAGQHPVLHLHAPRRGGPPQHPYDSGGGSGGLRPTPHPPVRRTHARNGHGPLRGRAHPTRPVGAGLAHTHRRCRAGSRSGPAKPHGRPAHTRGGPGAAARRRLATAPDPPVGAPALRRPRTAVPGGRPRPRGRPDRALAREGLGPRAPHGGARRHPRANARGRPALPHGADPGARRHPAPAPRADTGQHPATAPDPPDGTPTRRRPHTAVPGEPRRLTTARPDLAGRRSRPGRRRRPAATARRRPALVGRELTPPSLSAAGRRHPTANACERPALAPGARTGDRRRPAPAPRADTRQHPATAPDPPDGTPTRRRPRTTVPG
ncbi:hypothetical protein QF034_002349 [Streptomyces africanus]|uniref:Basic proline-rich protein n=1 Tax=Streptomyces africanus TaxID=231024 RepID=A0ABU0QL56_9ACTN|nr:hypothetical protein [Streptomyces africanus]